MSNVTELIVRQIVEQLQESVVVGKIEDVLRVIAGKGLFVNLLADAQERQVAFEINSEEGFGSSTKRVPLGVPRVRLVLRRGKAANCCTYFSEGGSVLVQRQTMCPRWRN